MNVKPISEKPNAGCSPILLIVFGSKFVIGGLVLLWFTFGQPIRNHFQCQSWPAVPAKIIVSQVERRRGDDNDSFAPIIRYEYKIGNQLQSSDCISFTNVDSSTEPSWANGFIKRYPLGANIDCYANPNQPELAVLEREFSPWILFMLYPVIIFGIGVLMIRSAWSAINKAKREKGVNLPPRPDTSSRSDRRWQSANPTELLSTGKPQDQLSEADALDLKWDVPQKLKPENAKLFLMIFLAIFGSIWNGVIWMGIPSMFQGGVGVFSVFMLLFMIPFVLVGLAVLGSFFYLLMSMFNPKVEIALSTGAIPRGGELDIAWEVVGRSGAIKQLTIIIEGIESATYRQGTDTKTDTQRFAELPIMESTDPQTIQFGSCTITIPADTMHTFEGDQNKILWNVVVHGIVPKWPDVKERYPFRVKP